MNHVSDSQTIIIKLKIYEKKFYKKTKLFLNISHETLSCKNFSPEMYLEKKWEKISRKKCEKEKICLKYFSNKIKKKIFEKNFRWIIFGQNFLKN